MIFDEYDKKMHSEWLYQIFHEKDKILSNMVNDSEKK